MIVHVCGWWLWFRGLRTGEWTRARILFFLVSISSNSTKRLFVYWCLVVFVDRFICLLGHFVLLLSRVLFAVVDGFCLLMGAVVDALACESDEGRVGPR